MKITQAVILAGGAGTRLKPFTLTNPKSLIPINGKPFLQHLIQLLKENCIKEVIILTGYLGNQIEDYFGNGSKIGIKIKYSHTPFLDQKGEENKSGVRIKNAENLLDDFFLLLYCDNYWPLDINKLLSFHLQHPSDVSTIIFSNNDNSTKDNIKVDKDGYVVKYDKTRTETDLNGVDIGFFIVKKKVLKLLPKSNSSFEADVLPKLILRKKLSGYLTNQKYYSIGDLQRVKITSKFLLPKKIIFLDRDGTINRKPPRANYVKIWNEFEFLPGAIEAIRLLTGNGYKIFLITNQPGIARGALTIDELKVIHQNMKKVIKNNGGSIEGIYFCPHNWDEGCDCRKPKPGLLLQASQDHFIHLRKTVFIGDDERDKQAGDSVNCKTILVTPQNSLLKIVKELVHNK